MPKELDMTGYVEIDGDLYPAQRIGPDGRPLPIAQEQADAIAAILVDEYETNEVFRAAVNAKAAALSEDQRGAA